MRPSIATDVQRVLRSTVTHRSSRWLFNHVYNHLSLTQKQSLHGRFRRVFYGQEPVQVSTFRVGFCGRTINLPLGGQELGLRWELALSLLGHEPEIKQLYADLARTQRKLTFMDVGANFGLHSFLFLMHGCRAVSFEPNPSCHSYFRQVCDLNGFHGELASTALTDKRGIAELRFPSDETWLGTIVDSVANQWLRDEGLTTIEVETTTLDGFIDEQGFRPDVIKIDTEGNEVAVLHGGEATLRNTSPLLIFESWPGPGRSELFSLLTSFGYEVYELGTSSRPLLAGLADFERSRASNFVGVRPESPLYEICRGADH